ncbi:MAG: hypothetical protein GX086_05845 [Alcaligenaceae bacterium]|jgi:SEC-C motif domain protein|nr:hypothetical protein [Alcaligenaceae bacterium]
MKKKTSILPCPCGGLPTGAPYEACCGRYISHNADAPDALRLMRSRYTAYTQGNADYVSATWHATTRPATLMLAMPDTPHATKWLGLSVHTFEVIDEAHAQVRFTARYRDGGKAFRMTELSDFVREDGQWFYVEGVVETSA